MSAFWSALAPLAALLALLLGVVLIVISEEWHDFLLGSTVTGLSLLYLVVWHSTV